MKKILLLLILTLSIAACSTNTAVTPAPIPKNEFPPYALATLPTPVLYTSDFKSVFGGEDGQTLKFDDYGEIDELEFIALPGTVFEIEDVIKGARADIYRVATAEYETDRALYIDSRMVTTGKKKPEQRIAKLPTKESIIANMAKADGGIYTWGGNWHSGIPQLLDLYPATGNITAGIQKQWILSGVDCSGLLYEATNGYTPRNTSGLIAFGEAVDIADKTAAEIAAALQPLDVIVWRGHNMIVIDGGKTIESRLDYDDETEGFQGGVRIRNLENVLSETMENRIPLNDYETPLEEDQKGFVVRRWYPES